MPSLFDDEMPVRKAVKQTSASAPLAERLRPRTWADFQADESFDRTLLQQLQAGAEFDQLNRKTDVAGFEDD